MTARTPLSSGIAFPGLQDDLNIERDTLELPDYVEVSADVTDFALDTTLTLATNSVFSALQDATLRRSTT